MDTWIVSRSPVGVLKQSLSDTTLPEAEVRPLFARAMEPHLFAEHYVLFQSPHFSRSS